MTAPRWDGLMERLDRLSALHRIHGAVASARARLDESRGRRWSAAEGLLRAWRYAGSERVAASVVDRVDRLVRGACTRDGALAPLVENEFLAEFARGESARAVRERYAGHPPEDRVRLRKPARVHDPERQGNLMLLKAADPSTGERGVLLVMYSHGLRELPAVFDLAGLASRYRIVIEPSWWGYQDAGFLLYHGSDLDGVVLAQRREDFDYIRDHGRNLIPVRLGAGDWADPDLFRPREDGERPHDVVMVAAWDPFKRHAVLFEALAAIRRRHGRRLRTALVGYPLGWDRARIEALAERHGVLEDCSFFESVPPEVVASVVGGARAFVLLSRREGANRALYESLFCDTPVLVPRGHRGVNLDHVNAATGLLFDDPDLPQAILTVVDGAERFSPRQWALAHTGWERSTHALNDALREPALRRGEPWTRDIVGRRNAPNLRYASAGLYREFEAEYAALAGWLRPVDASA